MEPRMSSRKQMVMVRLLLPRPLEEPLWVYTRASDPMASEELSISLRLSSVSLQLFELRLNSPDYRRCFDILYADARPMGYLPLIESLRRLTDLLHNPPYEYAQIPTGGNTDATTKVFRALLEADDTLLVEDFEFAPPIAAARALGAGVRGMQIDTKGVVPEALDELLSTWDTKLKGKKPHVMYTVPTGQNPSSASMTLERAKAVYAVARKHDLIIVEDDPYYTLCMDPYVGPASDGVPSTPTEPGRVALKDVHDLESFAKSLPRTYLSIDIDARVLRLDSFSKCFARE